MTETMADIMMANSSAGSSHTSESMASQLFDGYFASISGWQIAATTLMVLVAYDQCQSKVCFQ
jgi:sterol 22-desaturase